MHEHGGVVGMVKWYVGGATATTLTWLNEYSPAVTALCAIISTSLILLKYLQTWREERHEKKDD